MTIQEQLQPFLPEGSLIQTEPGIDTVTFTVPGREPFQLSGLVAQLEQGLPVEVVGEIIEEQLTSLSNPPSVKFNLVGPERLRPGMRLEIVNCDYMENYYEARLVEES